MASFEKATYKQICILKLSMPENTWPLHLLTKPNKENVLCRESSFKMILVSSNRIINGL